MDLSIIGSGYVGLVTGACFADVGHNVTCVDNDERKIEVLRAGRVPIYEPGLEELIHRNVAAHRLRFSGSIKEGVDNSQIVFIAVPTPPQSDDAADLMKKVYEPFMAPILVTDINSAELIKHAANSFLALKISYINAVSAICEASGADIEKVADGIGMDQRIGRNFLNAGIGYGGSCFPKDIAAFITISEKLGVPFSLLKEVQHINAAQKERFLKSIRDTLWVLREKKIAVWGLTFKPDTDDIRSSVAIELVADMLREGAQVSVYDPKGMERAREITEIKSARFCESALGAVDGAEALVIATEWAEFAKVDLAVVKEKMTTPIVFDGRNLFDPSTMAKVGFRYHSIGRTPVTPD